MDRNIDSKVTIKGVVSGSAQYDEGSRTLTLTDLNAESIDIGLSGQCMNYTIVLVGNSYLSGGVNADYTTELGIVGPGSLTIRDARYGISAGSYRYDGTVSNLTMSSGTVNVISPSGTGVSVSGGSFTMTGGTLNVAGAYGHAISVGGYEHRGVYYALDYRRQQIRGLEIPQAVHLEGDVQEVQACYQRLGEFYMKRYGASHPCGRRLLLRAPVPGRVSRANVRMGA